MTDFLQWHYPTPILCGPGARQALLGLLQQKQVRRPFLIVDLNLMQQSWCLEVIHTLRYQYPDLHLFHDFQSNPTDQDYALGIKQSRQTQSDLIICVGGGSCIDLGKTIAVMSHQYISSLWDLDDTLNRWHKLDADKILPTFAIPTTAGTGSEVGRASVITDSEQKQKRILFHPKMLPSQVILDPETTIGLPPHVTAATGMDALAHNLEAYCSPVEHPMAKGIATEGIRMIHQHLMTCYQKPTNIQARQAMLVASCMGATAFQAGLGAMHALAHSLGATYNKHHGLLNAILMPYVLKANRSKIESSILRLTALLNLPHSFEGFIDWIMQLRKNLDIPHTLQGCGIGLEKATQISELAVTDPTAATNPIAFNQDDYQKLFKKAVLGH